ncbi:MAG: 2-amino-4-hydroxy-6-hydroxymethyldihydropteridine diphosphokinase, partial [Phascolarctobacterium sp.]|nr:2-amino-4-hydroxy-6-hydroxymethyldihydropteridine diphosphokinase [Phascolarctobacterium sp.]
MSTAYVALGSNLGDREENLRSALKHLEENEVQVVKVSTFIETEPYGVTD